jgi:phosphate transport system substrate-binding protein
VRINYHSIGSGNGIRQLLAGEVDFGATDVPMSDDEIAGAPAPVFHIPMVVGAVAITYNVPELTQPLNLTSDVIADIFLGRIVRWNDSRIAASNPAARLPSRAITVVHRSDASGTSWIFSQYLRAVSERWRSRVRDSRTVMWPVGTGGVGNEGVAGHVKQSVGSVGYVEVVYARQNRLPTVHVQNRAGRFVSPLPFEVASAAAVVADTLTNSRDMRVSLVDAPGAQSYPIASFTWLLVSPRKLGVERTRVLADFIRWALSDGDQLAATMGYVALPQEATRRTLARLEEIERSR